MQNRNVIILGNGFDLNLGLPTSYTDFIVSSYFQDKIHYELFSFLDKQQTKGNWIDLENELTTYAQLHADKKYLTKRDSFYADFNELRTSLKEYLQSLDFNKIKDSSSFAAKFIKEKSQLLDNVLILNFNYTDTVSLILEGEHINEIKIHGSCNKEIILGVEDNADIAQHFTFLKKSTNLNYTVIDYNTILNDAASIRFFGYSLGKSDHSYFNDFFAYATFNKISKDIEFYYYREKGLLDLNQELDSLTKNSFGKFKQNANPKFIDVDKL